MKSPKLLKIKSSESKKLLKLLKISQRSNIKHTIFAYPLTDSPLLFVLTLAERTGILMNQLPSWILSQSVFLNLKPLELLPGNSMEKNLWLRFQHYKNIPFVWPWL